MWLWLFLLWVSYAAGKGCEPITIPLCKDVGYNMTAFPNGYGHEKQDEAGLEVHQFYPLVEVNCYQHLKFFLCTLYTPICQDNYDRPILPCMEMCLEAKKKCSPIMAQYGFRWPETLSCDSLPRMSDQMNSGNICAAPPDTPKDRKPMPTISTPVDTRPKVLIGTTDAEENDCHCQCRSPFQHVPTHKTLVGNVSSCSYPCRSPALTERHEKFMTNWIGVWSIICFVFSVFTILTFWIETDRFQYPERPIFMLAFCQAMVAVGFLIRFFFGHDQVACDAFKVKGAEDSNASICFLVFLLTYFFGMAASMWWLILSLTWVLAAASKWSSEAIASYSTYFHVMGWVFPGIQTVLVMAFNAIDGDPVSGLCYVGNTDDSALRTFVLAPLIVYFTFGILFLAVGFINLIRIRSEVQKQNPLLDNASRLTQLMSKIGIFSVLYTVPALFIILIHFYEQHSRPLWEQAAMCSCSSSRSDYEGYAFALALIKTACMCVVGWTSGVWVFSGKTFKSWINLICCLGRPVSEALYQPTEMIYAKSDVSLPPHFYNTQMRHNGHHYGGIPDKL